MLSCTLAHATPRMLLGPAPPQRRYGGLASQRRSAYGCRSEAGAARRAWLGRLRLALREQRFVLHYQPIVSLRDGAVAHHEALVRMREAQSGRLLAPSSFLPAAERLGLVCDIDRLVIERVARVLGDSAAAGDGARARPRRPRTSVRRQPVAPAPRASCAPARVAVNLSALSLTDERMLGHIERSLARHGAQPFQLVIEVTETASICDLRQARDFCDGVRALGCEVALDDFGAGFGAFHYLKHLPFTYLKIDGDFISGLAHSDSDQLVVSALVGLARGMAFSTIAEFVQDQPTLELLRALGVDYAQGFHIGRPSAGAPF